MSLSHMSITISTLYIKNNSYTKNNSFGTTFLKKVLPSIFLKFSAERVLCVLGHLFNKVNRGIVQKPDVFGT